MQHSGWASRAYLVVLGWFCSCATGPKGPVPSQYEDSRFIHLQPPHPPDEHFCRRDADCTIINSDFRECCPEQRFEPYAVSRKALDYYQSRCEPTCPALDIYPDEPADPEGFVAVCIGQACDRRQKGVSHDEANGQRPGESLPNKPLQRTTPPQGHWCNINEPFVRRCRR